MKILVTGGCGYTGTLLVQKLLKQNHEVIVIDNQWFGNHLKKHKKLKIIKKDIRSLGSFNFKNVKTVVHLANIANDPSVELNPNLSWDVNVIATKQLIEKCIKFKVKSFIFASSGSVYGIKKEKQVTENLELVPISIYNKTKMIAERVLMSYQNLIKIYCIRPATVCGYSPRMRLDITVNMFAMQALKNKKITVHGGKQIRPNIHINDLINIYLHFIKKPSLPSGFYNAGFENLRVIDIAKKVKKVIDTKIIIKNIKDVRSYRQNSNKLLATGFKRQYGVIDAIKDIKQKFLENKIKDELSCYTVKWMKKLNL
jgi:nucleoside-diphosphate-sugar epimerase|tara:strand:+ start:642 stop:1580 length:939 start_codon:yes stop_codon:yes gene_type:complete